MTDHIPTMREQLIASLTVAYTQDHMRAVMSHRDSEYFDVTDKRSVAQQITDKVIGEIDWACRIGRLAELHGKVVEPR